MQTSSQTVPALPSQKFVLRICIVIIVVLALAAGYYEATTENWMQTHQGILKHLKVKNTKELLSIQWERK